MKPDSDPFAEGISELEKTGVLMSRMLHELANCQSVLVGHMQIIERSKADPAAVASSLESVKWASDAMGEVVQRYASFRHQVQNNAAPCSLTDLIAGMQSALTALPSKSTSLEWNWPVISLANTDGRLQLEPRWIGAAVREIVEISQSHSGEVLIHRSGTSFDSRGLQFNANLSPSSGHLHLLVRWQSSVPVIAETDLYKPPTLNLVVAIGIIRWVLGQYHFTFIPPEENRFWITLPLV